MEVGIGIKVVFKTKRRVFRIIAGSCPLKPQFDVERYSPRGVASVISAIFGYSRNISAGSAVRDRLPWKLRNSELLSLSTSFISCSCCSFFHLASFYVSMILWSLVLFLLRFISSYERRQESRDAVEHYRITQNHKHACSDSNPVFLGFAWLHRVLRDG